MRRPISRLRFSTRQALQWLLLILHRNTIAFSFFVVLFVVALMAFSLYEVEPTHENSVWRAMVYLLSGVDVDPPDTFEGRAAAIVLLFSGVLVASLFTGYVAAVFGRVIGLAQFLPSKPDSEQFDNHIIIFGWGEKTKAILRELNERYKHPGIAAREIVIIADDARIERGSDAIYHHVWHVRGVPTDERVLERSNLRNSLGGGAQIAAILSDSSLSSDEADRQALLTVLAVEHVYPDVVSVAELREEANIEHFRNAYVDQCMVPDQYASLLLARTAAFPGMAGYIKSLLSLTAVKGGDAANPSFQLFTAAQLSVAGLLINEAVKQAYRDRGVIICGRKLGAKMSLLPDLTGASGPLEPSDLLVAIAKARLV